MMLRCMSIIIVFMFLIVILNAMAVTFILFQSDQVYNYCYFLAITVFNTHFLYKLTCIYIHFSTKHAKCGNANIPN